MGELFVLFPGKNIAVGLDRAGAGWKVRPFFFGDQIEAREKLSADAVETGAPMFLDPAQLRFQRVGRGLGGHSKQFEQTPFLAGGAEAGEFGAFFVQGGENLGVQGFRRQAVRNILQRAQAIVEEETEGAEGGIFVGQLEENHFLEGQFPVAGPRTFGSLRRGAGQPGVDAHSAGINLSGRKLGAEFL